jgi:uncharacterized protein YjbJ (UPF0337 family)
MINEQILVGQWNELKGKIRQKWGQLTENDLSQFQGNLDELIGKIQLKTGEGRAAIESFLQELAESASSTVGKAAGACKCGCECARLHPGIVVLLALGLGIFVGWKLKSH